MWYVYGSLQKILYENIPHDGFVGFKVEAAKVRNT